MLKTTMASVRGIFLAAILVAPAVAQAPAPHPPRPGSINYVEGQASIGIRNLMPGDIGFTELDRNQSITTGTGRVEILLAPGVLLRLADNSSLTMVSPDLTNTEVRLDKGRAMIEVIDIRKENNIRVDLEGATAQVTKKGLYDFDAARCEVRVFKGSAEVSAGNRRVTVGGDHKVTVGGDGLKSVWFEGRPYEDDFYRWNGLRSGYLSEAGVGLAPTYLGAGPGWYGPGWYGMGWYWSPWFGVYTFLPADGIFFGPFGWAFYSPIAVYRSPFAFYGYGGYPHRFGDFHYPYGHGFPPPGGFGARGGHH